MLRQEMGATAVSFAKAALILGRCFDISPSFHHHEPALAGGLLTDPLTTYMCQRWNGAGICLFFPTLLQLSDVLNPLTLALGIFDPGAVKYSIQTLRKPGECGMNGDFHFCLTSCFLL